MQNAADLGITDIMFQNRDRADAFTWILFMVACLITNGRFRQR